MGMTLETLKRLFPRSAAALDKHETLIDKYILDPSDRATLKTDAKLLAIVIADEVVGLRNRMDMLGSIIGGVVRRK